MKKKYGYMACRDCGERVVVKINERETLSYTCDECGDSGYCQKDQTNRAHWEKRITGATPAPAKAATDSKAAPTPARKGFDI